MTITERLAKQSEFRSYQYAFRLVHDKTGLRTDDFKHRASIYGDEWQRKIWRYCKQISPAYCDKLLKEIKRVQECQK